MHMNFACQATHLTPLLRYVSYMGASNLALCTNADMRSAAATPAS